MVDTPEPPVGIPRPQSSTPQQTQTAASSSDVVAVRTAVETASDRCAGQVWHTVAAAGRAQVTDLDVEVARHMEHLVVGEHLVGGQHSCGHGLIRHGFIVVSVPERVHHDPEPDS